MILSKSDSIKRNTFANRTLLGNGLFLARRILLWRHAQVFSACPDKNLQGSVFQLQLKTESPMYMFSSLKLNNHLQSITIHCTRCLLSVVVPYGEQLTKSFAMFCVVNALLARGERAWSSKMKFNIPIGNCYRWRIIVSHTDSCWDNLFL